MIGIEEVELKLLVVLLWPLHKGVYVFYIDLVYWLDNSTKLVIKEAFCLDFAQGSKVHTLYPLYVYHLDRIIDYIFLDDLPMSFLRQKRLTRLSKTDITQLFKASYISEHSYSDY